MANGALLTRSTGWPEWNDSELAVVRTWEGIRLSGTWTLRATVCRVELSSKTRFVFRETDAKGLVMIGLEQMVRAPNLEGHEILEQASCFDVLRACLDQEFRAVFVLGTRQGCLDSK